MTEFWLKNPEILLNNFCDFNPLLDGTTNEKLNAYTRLTIYITVLLLCLTKKEMYLYIGVIIKVLIIIFENIIKKRII